LSAQIIRDPSLGYLYHVKLFIDCASQIPIKRQRVTKYFTENIIEEERATTHYKAWKEEDKPADSYRHFIKHYLSPFVKECGHTVSQVYSVIGGRIWKGVIAP
ncbi:MAG: hypothetical protein EZS28_023682, partial [Streblomastix strix]